MPLVLGLLIIAPAVAQAPWAVQPGATEVSFVARRFGMPTASGRFQQFDGVVALDFERPERSRIRIRIDTGSLQTGTPLVDAFIKGESMLDAARHPVASFVSDAVSRTGDGSLAIRGQLTIRAITRPVTATAVADGDPGAAQRGGPLAFHANAAFSRSAFNIGADVNVVDDQVEIAIKGRLSR
ncbi:MAG TPA: YceI family protein [Bosea sp. (in: a-proteobacteria)]|uniref:YceI family protein n=1 Tax=Bosea sp. (in: a-proteobacteria) TaxID=1871050 RepID=UPI002E106DF1|nr:YceI family protein [Bosea sp. (in: a-proteobacteria)]